MDEPVEVPIEDWLDLHTFRPKDVPDVLAEYLYQAVLKGFRFVRIIHGRGIGVQREIVRAFVSRHPDVVGYSDTPDRGATLVELENADHR